MNRTLNTTVVVMLCVVAAGFRLAAVKVLGGEREPKGDALALEVADNLANGKGFSARPLLVREQAELARLTRDVGPTRPAAAGQRPPVGPGAGMGAPRSQGVGQVPPVGPGAGMGPPSPAGGSRAAASAGEAVPTGAVMPAYPFLLSFPMKLGSSAATAVIAVNVFLALLGVIAVWGTAKELFGDLPAFLAGLLWALDPLQGFLASHAEPALMATTFGFASLWLLAVDADEMKALPVLVSALAMGVAVLSHPAGLLFVVPGFIILLTPHVGAGRKVVCVEVWAAVVVACLGGWTVRNARTFDGKVVPLTTIIWEDFARGNNRDVYDSAVGAGLDPTAADWQRTKLGTLLSPGVLPVSPGGLSELAADGHYRRSGWRYVRKSPSFAAELFFCKLRRLWGVKPGWGQAGFVTASIVYFVALYVAAFLGLVVLRNRRAWLNAFLIVLVLFTAAHSIQWAEVRQRIEVAPVLFVLAGGVVAGLRQLGGCARQMAQVRRARRKEKTNS